MCVGVCVWGGVRVGVFEEMGVATLVYFDPGGVHLSGETLQIQRAVQ